MVAVVGIEGSVDRICDERSRPRTALVTQVTQGWPVDLPRAGPRAGLVSAQLRRRARPGHDLHPLHAVRPAGPDGLHRPAGTPPVLPAARLGRARRGRDLVHRQEESCRRHSSEAGVEPRQVVALGVTNQRETTVVWNRHTGVPVGPGDRLAGHQDQRHCSTGWPARSTPTRSLPRTGLPMATYFSGSKLRWLLDRDPTLRPAAERGDLLFGTMDSWITWNLTGGPGGSGAGAEEGLHVTDVTNASRTMLMDLETLDWDDGPAAPHSASRGRCCREIRPSIGRIGDDRRSVARHPDRGGDR